MTLWTSFVVTNCVCKCHHTPRTRTPIKHTHSPRNLSEDHSIWSRLSIRSVERHFPSANRPELLILVQNSVLGRLPHRNVTPTNHTNLDHKLFLLIPIRQFLLTPAWMSCRYFLPAIWWPESWQLIVLGLCCRKFKYFFILLSIN